MLSKIIPITTKHRDTTQTNQNDFFQIIFQYISHKNYTKEASLQLQTTVAIHNTFKNNPFKPNSQEVNLIRESLIQISSTHVSTSKSTISVTIHRLIARGILIKVDGMVMLHPVFRDLDKVEQLVFRINKL